MRRAKNRSTSAVVSEYRYNALGYRIAWHYDVTSASSPFGPDGSVNDTDPWYFFAYNERWQKWGVIRGTSSSGAITLDANPKEIFVHHKAGAGGFGGSSYIDSVLLRERDTTPEWRQAADSTRDETLYYVQNWRADVIGLASSQGGLVDHVRYSPYGVPTRVNPVDIADDAGNALSSSSGANGGLGEGDYNYFMNEFLSDGAGADIASGVGEIFPGGDGAVNEGDYNLFFNEFFVTYARGQLTADSVANRLGYAGYEFDPVLIGSGSGAAASDPTCFYHVRHRVYDSQNGRWTRRDPLGYVDGMGLYEYCRSSTLTMFDYSGLAADQIYSAANDKQSNERCCSDAIKYYNNKQDDRRPPSSYPAVTICCNGKPLICFSPAGMKRDIVRLPTVRPTNGKQPTDAIWLQEMIESTVYAAKWRCVNVHESQHVFDALNRGTCDKSKKGFSPISIDAATLACDECRAYSAELSCLEGRLGDCDYIELLAKQMGLDPRPLKAKCVEAIQREIDLVKSEQRRYCNECTAADNRRPSRCKDGPYTFPSDQ